MIFITVLVKAIAKKNRIAPTAALPSNYHYRESYVFTFISGIEGNHLFGDVRYWIGLDV